MYKRYLESMAKHETTISKSDLKEGKLFKADVDGKTIVITLVSGKVYAMDAVCSHEGGPLEEGSIDGYSLICPWHQGIFDIRTAKASAETDWVTDLHSYAVIIDDNSGKISVDTDSNASHTNAIHDVQAQERIVKDDLAPSRPLKMELKLLEKFSHEGTDIMSFKISRRDGQDYLNYRAGQFSIMDLGTKEDPKGATRSFTIASSPTEKEWILVSTRIRDSPFKQKLSKLDVGASVKITAAFGKFTLPEDNSKPVVFLSGGIGVTPFRSMMKYATDKQLPLKITMFDANRNQQNILYREEFDGWSKLNENLKIVYTISNEEADAPSLSAASEWKGEKGFIDKSMLLRHLSEDETNNAVFYICGPPAMLNAMQKLLSKELGVPDKRIKVELFTGY
jgi:ferredoxin-NADP reductase/nitrite reductase/ring-hydroxylating ferredoxin subunit